MSLSDTDRPAEGHHRVASTNGVELALHHFGGSGPTMVICHATGFHARCYRPMLPRLTSDFDVWGLDFRGHGASTPPDRDNFAWRGFGEDLLAVIDHIGVDAVRVFAHSMGGAATLLAEKSRPGVIDAAWLYEPIILPPGVVPRNSTMAEAAANRRAEFESRAEALYRYSSRAPLGLLRADVLAAYVEDGFHDTDRGTVTLACQPAHEARTFAGARIHIGEIAGLTPRMTIARGETVDGPNAAEFAGPVADALPNASLLEYSSLSHLGPLQDPDGIAGDVARFLS